MDYRLIANLPLVNNCFLINGVPLFCPSYRCGKPNKDYYFRHSSRQNKYLLLRYADRTLQRESTNRFLMPLGKILLRWNDWKYFHERQDRNFFEVHEELPWNFSRHHHTATTDADAVADADADHIEMFLPRSGFLTRRAALHSSAVSVLSRRSNLCSFRRTVNGYTVGRKKKKKERQRDGQRKSSMEEERERERCNKKTSIPGTSRDRCARRFHTHNKLLKHPLEALIYRGVSPGAVFFRRSRARSSLWKIFFCKLISLSRADIPPCK